LQSAPAGEPPPSQPDQSAQPPVAPPPEAPPPAPALGNIEDTPFSISMDDEPQGAGPLTPGEDPMARAMTDLGIPKETGEKLLEAFKGIPASREIVSDARAVRNLQKPVEEGGIGFKPTSQQMIEHYKGHIYGLQVDHMFDNGDVNGFTRVFFQKAPTGESRPGAIAFAEQFPVALYQQNPEAYSRMVPVIMLGVAEEWAKQAAAEADPDMRQRIVDAANLIRTEHGVAPIGGTPAGQPQAGQSPEIQRLIQENQRLSQENQGVRDRMETRDRQGAQQVYAQRRTTLDRQLDADLMSNIKAAMAPVRERMTSDSEKLLYGALEQDYFRKAKESAYQNIPGVNLLKIHFKNAVTSPNFEGKAKEAVVQFRSMYRAFVEQNRANFIRAAAGDQRRAAVDAAAELQAQQSRRSPGGSGAPAGAGNNGQKPAMVPGESAEEYFNRTLTVVAQNLMRPT
jgi:hypothetical protein